MPEANATFMKFQQFQKVEEKADGTPVVYGIATQQKPDLDNEVCDYKTAKGVYREWSDAAAKRTKKSGQEVSLGNIRLQHGLDIGGKVTKLEFNDAEQEIWLGSDPLNDDIAKQVKAGYYTGYSQGGSYAWRECMTCETPLSLSQASNYCPKCDKQVTVLYGLRSLAEVSYVDSPCSGVGFEYVKSDGSKELVKFQKRENPMAKETTAPSKEELERISVIVAAELAKQKVEKEESKTKRVAGEELKPDAFAFVGDAAKTSTWKLPIKFSDEVKTKRHIRNALSRIDQTKGIPDDKKPEVKAKIEAAAKEHGIDVAEAGKAYTAAVDKVAEIMKAAIDKQAESAGLQKGLYEVARYADILQGMACLYECTLWEREIEGDESEVPDDLKDVLETMIDIFISMATEEAKELAARKAQTSKQEKAMTPEELIEQDKLAKKARASHFAKAAVQHEKLADEHEKSAGHHMDMHKAHMDMHAAHKAANVGTGAEGGENEHVGAGAVEFHKAAMAGCKDCADAAKALHGTHMAKAKMHEKLADHFHKMSKGEDKDEHEKAVKDEGFVKGVKPAPEVKPAAEPDAFAKAITEKAHEALLADPEFLEEVKKAQREKLMADLVEKGLPGQIKPDVVKGAGPSLVSRDGSKSEFAKTPATGTDGPGF